MNIRVIRSERSLQDVAEILSYYEDQDPAVADRFALALEDSCEFLGQHPRVGKQYAGGRLETAEMRYW